MKITLRKLVIIIAVLLFSLSCSEEKPKPYVFDGRELNRLKNLFLNGDSSGNLLLGFLYHDINPGFIKVNNLFIDSVTFGTNKTVYTLLLESENPVFNLFLAIDNKMNVLLKDNSLNGNLTFGYKYFNRNTYAIIVESFKSMDTIKIERTSLYEIKSDLTKLIFRSVTGFNFGSINTTSKITRFNKEEIKLSFETEYVPSFKNKEEIFVYNQFTDRYISENNYLKSFIMEQINKVKIDNDVQQITDRNSIEKLLTGKGTNFEFTKFSKEDYTISLSNDWREFENFSITQYVKNEYKGNKYLNERLGASIFLIKIAKGDSAEMFVEYNLKNKNIYEHPVRYTDLQEAGRHFVSVYEYYCNNKKYLLILEVPKFTYVRNVEIYESIIKTFKIIC